MNCVLDKLWKVVKKQRCHKNVEATLRHLLTVISGANRKLAFQISLNMFSLDIMTNSWEFIVFKFDTKHFYFFYFFFFIFRKSKSFHCSSFLVKISKDFGAVFLSFCLESLLSNWFCCNFCSFLHISMVFNRLLTFFFNFQQLGKYSQSKGDNFYSKMMKWR